MHEYVYVYVREKERALLEEGVGRARAKEREKVINSYLLPVGYIGLASVLSFEWGHP
jgi:hypothetical protein